MYYIICILYITFMYWNAYMWILCVMSYTHVVLRRQHTLLSMNFIRWSFHLLCCYHLLFCYHFCLLYFILWVPRNSFLRHNNHYIYNFDNNNYYSINKTNHYIYNTNNNINITTYCRGQHRLIYFESENRKNK